MSANEKTSADGSQQAFFIAGKVPTTGIVSRVLLRQKVSPLPPAIIYLVDMSPYRSSRLSPQSPSAGRRRADVYVPHAMLLGIGFTAARVAAEPGELLPRRSTLTRTSLCVRYISVALSLESPPADVIRYPCPSSPDFPHAPTFRSARRNGQRARNRAFRSAASIL